MRPTSDPHRDLGALTRPDGGFAMVALDQRESLRAMFAAADPAAPVPDDRLRKFKADATRALSPYASAVLLDRPYGLDDATPEALHPSCALILAADDLVQEPGQPVRDSRLDPAVTAEYAESIGAAALKLLVIWQRDRRQEVRAELITQFTALCEKTNLPGIVEAVVTPPPGAGLDDWGRDDAIVAAAHEIAVHRPDLYKAQVPAYGRGDPEYIARRCAEITAALDGPWVVLSTGVNPEDFPTALAAACAGGASGFLAGRAIWADAITADHPNEWLATTAVERLRHLGRIVASRSAHANGEPTPPQPSAERD